MESRSQRRLFQSQSATTSSAGHHRSRVPLRSDQRRKSAEESVVTALVDTARDRNAEKLQGVFARHSRISSSGQCQGPCVYPPSPKRNRSRRGKSFPFRTVR